MISLINVQQKRTLHHDFGGIQKVDNIRHQLMHYHAHGILMFSDDKYAVTLQSISFFKRLYAFYVNFEAFQKLYLFHVGGFHKIWSVLFCKVPKESL